MTTFDPVKLREAYRNAFPLGTLLARGVTTFGGFTCIGEVKGDHPAAGWHFARRVSMHGQSYQSCIVKPDDTPERVRGIAGMVGESDDDLLPDLDPTRDPATWACALQDLADACAGTGKHDPRSHHGCFSLAWVQDLTGSWRLYGYDLRGRVFFLDWTVHSGVMLYFHTSVYDTSCPGPAEADQIIGDDADLVLAFLLARAQVRKEVNR